MNADPRDYKLDLSSLREESPQASAPAVRPYLSVLFACCKRLSSGSTASPPAKRTAAAVRRMRQPRER